MITEDIVKKLPINYKNALEFAIESAKSIYKEELIAIMLAGSGGKGNIIDGWSDLDLYIITNSFNISENRIYQNIINNNKFDIHIGTTFYIDKMFENSYVDEKTLIAFYEYNTFKCNPLVFGKIKVPDVNYEKILSDTTNLYNNLQVAQRELYRYINSNDNLNTLLKKVTLLVKKYLNKRYGLFIYGYEDTYELYNKKTNNLSSINIKKIILTKDEDKQLVSYFTEVIEFIIKDLF